MDTNIFALLVGIDKYQSVSKLRGCVNDVEVVEQFLTEKYLVPKAHVKTLKDEEASRQNILDVFQTFLIQNPNIKRDDQILFWYSGHGSRMLDTSGTEPDGYLETLVPQDSRTQDIHDIPDKVVARLLEDLAEAKGHNITVVLDSCHSGSGTRELNVAGETVALAREISADDRIPPADLDKELLNRSTGSDRLSSGWSSPTTPYVLLAGCRSNEQSNEYLVPAEGDTKVWHGTLTYFILKALGTIAPDTTYADIHEKVAAQVNGVYPTQMPQCEGDRNRIFLGGARIERDTFILVREFDGKVATLDSGLIMGLTPGTKLALYESTVRHRNDLPERPLARIEVISAQATFSKARVEIADQLPFMSYIDRWAKETLGNSEGANQITSKPLKGAIARGVVTERTYVSIPPSVSLWPEERETNKQAIIRLHDSLQSHYYHVLDEPAKDSQFHVVAADGYYLIQNSQEMLLVEPIPWGEGSLSKVNYTLENIVRFQTLLRLNNEESGSTLSGRIKVHLRADFSTIEQAELNSSGALPETEREILLPEGAIGSGGELSLIYDPENEAKNFYTVEVENTSSRNIYPHIFVMSADYSIGRLYPEPGLEKPLTPGNTLSAVNANGGKRMEIYLPEGEAGEVQWDSSRDYVIVVAATAPSDLSGLEQEGLSVPPPARSQKRAQQSPLDALVGNLLFDSQQRHIRPDRMSPTDDWATVLVSYTTVRKNSKVTLAEPADRLDLGDGLTLLKPQGFKGEITVTTVTQCKRGTEGDPMLELPPGLTAFGETFQPLERAGVRSVGSAQLVITFDIDDASQQSINPDNPLGIEIDRPAGEDLFEYVPVIFDGEDYLIAGYSTPGSTRVNLVELPAAVAPKEAGQPTQRGLLRTLRLFLYKKMGRYTPLTGLHQAELVNGKVVYHDVDRRQFQSGQRVALFVHGFTSDTGWMIQGPAQFLQQEVVPYDHFLTWDYETFGTRIQSNGEELALALKQQCGFGPDDGILLDVFAHSMGSLVCRSMIELSGGYKFVNRLVMAGPPNKGSTLATSGRGMLFLANALLNSASLVPPVGVLQKVLNQILDQGAGLQDLEVNSEILRQMNSLEEPSNVPYLVLAGENLVDEAGYKRLNRLAQKILDTSLDTIFGEQNDIAVGLSSLRTVRGGAYPQLKVITLPCNHFQYYSHQTSRETIKQWIKENE